MSFFSLLAFSLPVLSGTLIAHLLWLDKNSPLDLFFKFSLGTGLGLGISALLYFVCLLFFAGRSFFLYVEAALFLSLLTAAYLKRKRMVRASSPRLKITLPQAAILLAAVIVFLSSFIGMVNYSRQRARGDWDAWMIYNRAARFIFRGGENWRDAFSSEMGVIFHADYPPLLALNTASRWEILGEETAFVPMIQGFLFSLAALGLSFGALAELKSLAQGGVGLILLGGVPFFLGEGGRQTADLPLAFYLLASLVSLFFYFRDRRAAFLALAGFMAGLAAWTKNEGMLFLFASVGILFTAALWKRSLLDFLLYFAGALPSLLLLFYFKSQIAPPSEFLGGGSLFPYLADGSRHQLIFSAFEEFFLHGGGWFGIGIYLVLSAYFLLFYSRGGNPAPILISLAILVFQMIGYYVVYLISPYDLTWHIGYSLNRLFVQIYPSAVFVVLYAGATPEMIFPSRPK